MLDACRRMKPAWNLVWLKPCSGMKGSMSFWYCRTSQLVSRRLDSDCARAMRPDER